MHVPHIDLLESQGVCHCGGCIRPPFSFAGGFAMTAPTILEAEHRPTAVALAIMAVESRGSKRRETLLEFIRRFELWIGREGRRGRRERGKKKKKLERFIDRSGTSSRGWWTNWSEWISPFLFFLTILSFLPLSFLPSLYKERTLNGVENVM